MPGELSATLEQGLARLCSVLPFAQAAEHLAFFWGVQVSASTARRHAEAVGAAYVAVQEAELQQLEQACPVPPAGPPLQQVSADGAMVPLVGGKWAEVRTVAVATVGSNPRTDQAQATEPSYFSRLTDHDTFIRSAQVELHRRGTETAGVVVGVMDGAPWLQELLDRYRPDATRVLDLPHALGHLATTAQATFGAGSAALAVWLEQQADALKHGASSAVLLALVQLPAEQAANPTVAVAERDKTFRYLEHRLDQIQYAEFLARGYPIGSGLVESANKLVVEVRLKGSGMHWRSTNVNPMLALRNIACNERWPEAWPQICTRLRSQEQAARAARQQARHLRLLPAPPPAPPPPRPAVALPKPAPRVVNGRPAADHPWRRPFLRGGRDRAAS